MSPLFYAVGASGKGCCKPLRRQRYNKKMTYANFMSFFCVFCKIEDRNRKISGYLLFPNDHLCLVRHGGEDLLL